MLIFKICPLEVWMRIQHEIEWTGSADDLRDGFIHFSTDAQLSGTLAKHFAGRSDLMILAVDETQLGPGLRWEPSRGGELFPHLYGPLPLAAVVSARSSVSP